MTRSRRFRAKSLQRSVLVCRLHTLAGVGNANYASDSVGSHVSFFLAVLFGVGLLCVQARRLKRTPHSVLPHLNISKSKLLLLQHAMSRAFSVQENTYSSPPARVSCSALECSVANNRRVRYCCCTGTSSKHTPQNRTRPFDL